MNPRNSISLIMALVLWILATFGPGTAQAAVETESWSTVKSHYGQVSGERSSGPRKPGATSKPTLEAIPCPDGELRTVVELLRMANDLYPEDELWRDPDLRAVIFQERGWWADTMKWIKENVKFSIDYFGINIEVYTEDDLGQPVCTQFSWAWNAGVPYLGPCL